MASFDVFDAFNDCIDRLNAGQSLDDCLRAYPQHADRLRPLLETAILVRRARPAVPPGAQARVRQQVMQAAPRRSLRLSFTSPGLALAAASVLVVAFVLALLLANRDTGPSLRIEPLPTGTPTPTVTLTPPPSATASPSAIPSATISPTATRTVTATPTPSPTPTATSSPSPTATPSPTLSLASGCTLTIAPASVNLRSGPGIGYSIVGYGFAGETFAVTAGHTSELWFQIQRDQGEAWVAASVATLAGDCSTLPISTLTLRATPDSGDDDGVGDDQPGDSGDDDGGEDQPGDSGDDAGDDDGDDDDDDDGDDGGDD